MSALEAGHGEGAPPLFTTKTQRHEAWQDAFPLGVCAFVVERSRNKICPPAAITMGTRIREPLREGAVTPCGCIVVIDHEREMPDLLRDLLGKKGCTVLVASDSDKGMEMVARERPALVILNLKMPATDGLAVLREIKKYDELTSVIVVARFADIGRAREAMRLGALDYFTKPFDVGYVEAVIKSALEQTLVTC